jgi:hypothetical protein
MKIRIKMLSLVGFLLLTGCTNVISSDKYEIGSLHSKGVETNTIFATAESFFSAADYGCNVYEGEFGCSMLLHNWIVHDTNIRITIRPNSSDESKLEMFASRRDEGLLPGDVLPDKYQNDDVVKFCRYLVKNKIGFCRKD